VTETLSYPFVSPLPGLDLGAKPKYPAYAKMYHLARLPGNGEKPEYCGAQRWMLCNSCSEGSRGFLAKRSCITRDCPECYEKWAFKGAKKAAWRLWTGARYVSRQIGCKRFRLLHCVVSFPIEDPDATFNSYRNRAYEVLREHGIEGGLSIWHPLRKNPQWGVFEYDGYVHFHMIGATWGDVKPGREDSGYVFKVVKDAEGGDYRGFKSPGAVRRALAYLLSHCGVMDGVHAVTWFGVLSYNRMAIEKLKAFAPDGWDDLQRIRSQKCPYCGSDDTEPMDSWQYYDRYCRWEYRERSRYLPSAADRG
jgi:hypothetical protein